MATPTRQMDGGWGMEVRRSTAGSFELDRVGLSDRHGGRAPPTRLTFQVPCPLPPFAQRSPEPPCLCLPGASHPGVGPAWAQAPQGAVPWACGPASSHPPDFSSLSWATRSPGSYVWEVGLLRSGTSSEKRKVAMRTWDPASVWQIQPPSGQVANCREVAEGQGSHPGWLLFRLSGGGSPAY